MNINVKLGNEAWEALFTAHTVLIREFQAEDIWQELSMREYDVLYTLSKSPEPMRLGDVRDGVLLSQPALSRLIERLVERGLVDRREDATDRRAVHLSLTGEGRELQRSVGTAHAKSVAGALSALTDDELGTLTGLCQKLCASRAPNNHSDVRSTP